MGQLHADHRILPRHVTVLLEGKKETISHKSRRHATVSKLFSPSRAPKTRGACPNGDTASSDGDRSVRLEINGRRVRGRVWNGGTAIAVSQEKFRRLFLLCTLSQFPACPRRLSSFCSRAGPATSSGFRRGREGEERAHQPHPRPPEFGSLWLMRAKSPPRCDRERGSSHCTPCDCLTHARRWKDYASSSSAGLHAVRRYAGSTRGPVQFEAVQLLLCAPAGADAACQNAQSIGEHFVSGMLCSLQVLRY
ncbi:hypothetical protein BR93DRAFT_177823 [Coniochaeta sp. PMI_546]|nr:hypothetical protein BR93DRAFT_177823 [Coniochaeta sp. PMI_546]